MREELEDAYELCEALRDIAFYAEHQYDQAEKYLNICQNQLRAARERMVEAHRRAGLLQRVAGRGVLTGKMWVVRRCLASKASLKPSSSCRSCGGGPYGLGLSSC